MHTDTHTLPRSQLHSELIRIVTDIRWYVQMHSNLNQLSHAYLYTYTHTPTHRIPNESQLGSTRPYSTV